MLVPILLVSQALLIVGAHTGRVAAWVPGIVLNVLFPLYLFASPSLTFDHLAQLFVLSLCALFVALFVRAKLVSQVLAWLVSLGELVLVGFLAFGA